MLRDVSEAIKRRAPGVHNLIKSIYYRSGVPAIKFLNGRFVIVAPGLLGASPTEPHVLAWINASLKPGDTFFDVGAHHGWMSLAACHRVGSRGKVVAFEPSPPLVARLEYNKKANRLHQMEIVSKAIGNVEAQKVSFHVVNLGESFLNSLVDRRSTAVQIVETTTIEVETVSLDKFCETTKLRPNVVKIDIEGGELLALQGSRRLLEEGRATFLVAVHPCWLPQGQEAAEVFDLFRFHGYKMLESLVVPHEGIEFGDYLFAPDRS